MLPVSLFTDILMEQPFSTHEFIWVLLEKSYEAIKLPEDREVWMLKAESSVNLDVRSAALVAGLFVNINFPDRKNVGGGDGSVFLMA